MVVGDAEGTVQLEEVLAAEAPWDVMVAAADTHALAFRRELVGTDLPEDWCYHTGITPAAVVWIFPDLDLAMVCCCLHPRLVEVVDCAEEGEPEVVCQLEGHLRDA